ncbi:DMT family transporter [Cellulomonas sp. P24]|uniref:DMT family transporter n=1 Tax=Cellulomonas sp. P24 TaxID=2885206 RepID=UPI00216B3B8F|nr:DMT family transporter [Cellulomonas sp. P24]MCR6491317.1 DMT family transporter [Cellulomonas sp. P24]
MTRRGWLLLGAVGAIWGIPYLLIKIAVAEVSPPTIVFARTAVGAIVLMPFALRSGGLRPLRGRWTAVAMFAALEIVGPWLLLSNAERVLASSTTGLLVATVPILAVVLGRFVGDRRPVSAVRWVGLVVGLGGVVLLLGPGAVHGHAWSLGQVLLAALGYAIAPIVADRALRGVPAVTLTAACLTLAALVYAPVVAATGLHTAPGPGTIAALLTLGVVCTALAFVLFFALITEVGAARSTLVAYINPVVAVALGAAVLSEPITPLVVIAMVLIVGGSAAGSHRSPVPDRSADQDAPVAGAAAA